MHKQTHHFFDDVFEHRHTDVPERNMNLVNAGTSGTVSVHTLLIELCHAQLRTRHIDILLYPIRSYKGYKHGIGYSTVSACAHVLILI